MTKRKTKKVFDTFEQIAYKDWIGLGEFESYECSTCGQDIDFPKRKCPECGALHTFEKATLELIRSVQIKEGTIPPIPEHILKWKQEVANLPKKPMSWFTKIKEKFSRTNE